MFVVLSDSLTRRSFAATLREFLAPLHESVHFPVRQASETNPHSPYRTQKKAEPQVRCEIRRLTRIYTISCFALLGLVPLKGAVRCSRMVLHLSSVFRSRSASKDDRHSSGDRRQTSKSGANMMGRHLSLLQAIGLISSLCVGGSLLAVRTTEAALGPAGSAVSAAIALPVSLTVEVLGNGLVTSFPAGINCSVACAADMPVGEIVQLTAWPVAGTAGSIFIGWGGACAGTAGCFVTMDQATAVTATFIPGTRLQLFGSPEGIRLVASPAGTSCGQDCFLYRLGEIVTLTPLPKFGYLIDWWQNFRCSGLATCSVTMDGNRGFSYNSLPVPGLSVGKQGNGRGAVTASAGNFDCPASTQSAGFGVECVAGYLPGTIVELTATPDANTSATWTQCPFLIGDVCTVYMDGDHHASVTFTKITKRLTIDASTGGSVTTSPAGNYCGPGCHEFDLGTSVEITTTAFYGYFSQGLTGLPCLTPAPCTVTMNEDKAIGASFILGRSITIQFAGPGTGSISFSDGSETCTSYCSRYLYPDTPVTITASATSPSAFLKWWELPCGAAASCDIGSTGNLFLTVSFMSQTVSTSALGTGSGSLDTAPSNYLCGFIGRGGCHSFLPDTPITITATPAYGSTFEGWNSDGPCAGASNVCSFTVTSNTKVAATFAAMHLLFIHFPGDGYSGHGIVSATSPALSCSSLCGNYVRHGDQVTLTATPSLGSYFAGWSDGCTGTAACVITMDSAQRPGATFLPLAPELTISRSGDGYGIVRSEPIGLECGFVCTKTFGYGASVTLTATPDLDSRFVGWTGACTGTLTTCQVTMTDAAFVGATFGPASYNVAINKGGSSGTGVVISDFPGLGCDSQCPATNAWIPYARPVVLTAVADSDSVFQGWSGACLGTGVCELPGTQSQGIAATFTLKNHPVTVTIDGSGSGFVTDTYTYCSAKCSTPIQQHQIITLTAWPQPGSVFSGWSGACAGLDPCTITVESATDVGASFLQLTAPTAPQSATAVSGATSATLAWTPPSNDGGQSIEFYYVETQAFGSPNWLLTAVVTGSTRSITIPDLVNATTYLFRVSAHNGHERGGYVETTTTTQASLPPSPPAAGSSYTALSPARLLETRPGETTTVDGSFWQTGQQGAGTTTELTVAGRGGVPDNASAAVLNMTVTSPQTAGFITVYPCGTTRPNASNLNYTAGQTIANAVITKIGLNGKICIYTPATTHLIADVNGYFPTG